MWAEERLNVKRRQWNQSVHTCLLVMYGMFTQSECLSHWSETFSTWLLTEP